MRTRTEKKRQEILDAATNVFKERGYEATTMSEIVSRIGGSKATLYGYFPSKSELFIAVIMQIAHRVGKPVFDPLAQSENLETALADLGLTYLRFITDDDIIAFKRILVSEGKNSELCRSFYASGPRKGWARLAEILQTFMDEGRICKGDAFAASMQLKGLIECGPYEKYLQGIIEKPSLDDLTAQARLAARTFVRAYDVRWDLEEQRLAS